MVSCALKATILFCLMSLCCGFNVDTNISKRLLRSPIFEAYQDERTGSLSSDFAPSYFGYQINVQSQPTLSVKVGAPKTVDPYNPFEQSSSHYPASRGNVLNCSISFSSSLGSCVSSAPPGSALGDSFGLSLSDTPDTFTACSPTKKQSCRSVNHSPGFCYNHVKGREGARWRPDPRTSREACRLRFIDMVFLLDASGSIGEDNFNLVKNWTKAVASGFRIRDGSTRIGVVRYSFWDRRRTLNNQLFINTEIELGSIKDRGTFNRRVDRIRETNLQTFTAHALNKTEQDFRSSNGFNQPNTAKILILLTDGKSTDGDQLSESAEYIRSLGITTFAVGVGDAQEDELRTIATGTDSDERVFYVSNFDLLDSIVGQIETDIRSTALEGSLAFDDDETATQLEHAQQGFSIHSNPKGVTS